MIDKGAAATPAVGLVAPAGAASTPPAVRWLVADWDAVRVQIKNEDNAWACALIVLRPDWTIAGDQAKVEGNLRGIWYDAGSNIPGDNGLHHCSPATVAAEDFEVAYGLTGTPAGNDPLPTSGSEWTIPYDDDGDSTTGNKVDPNVLPATTDDIAGRWLQRTVPDFSAS